MDVVVAYDIADTQDPVGARRLREVAAVCQRYGSRVQFSVFECRVSPTAYTALVQDLQDVIEDGDSVIIYRFDGTLGDHRVQLASDKGHPLDEPWLL